MYPDVRSKRREIVNRDFTRSSYLCNLLESFEKNTCDIFSSDGVVANWEFVPFELSPRTLPASSVSLHVFVNGSWARFGSHRGGPSLL